MSNRFALLHEELRGPKPPAANGGPRREDSRQAPVRARMPVSYRVPGTVHPTRQPGSATGWAAATAMLASWREGRAVDVASALRSAGPRHGERLAANQPLSPAEHASFLGALGLVVEPPRKASVELLERSLRQFGALWVTAEERNEAAFSPRPLVVVGLRGDGSSQRTQVEYIDPQSAVKRTASVREFAQALVPGRTLDGPPRLRLIHWPEDAVLGIRRRLGLAAAAAALGRREEAPDYSWQHGVNDALDVSESGVAFVTAFEGFRERMYDDQAGHCTIGYGHLIHEGRCTGSDPREAPFRDGITQERATEQLRQHLAGAARAVRAGITVPLDQHQFDALVSFVYNVGSGAFQGSTLRRVINAGQGAQAARQAFLMWVKVRQDGQLVTSRGLVNRRTAEANLFEHGTYARAQALGSGEEEGVVPDRATLWREQEGARALESSLQGLPVPSVNLQRGARGPEVQELQTALVRLGHMTQEEMNTGPGVFGRRTEECLQAFQRAQGVSPTGTYGPQTRAALQRLGATVANPAPAPAPAPGNAPTGPASRVQTVARALLQGVQGGQLALTNPRREGAQLSQLSQHGHCTVDNQTATLHDELLTTLESLLSHSTPRPGHAPFSILSLVRTNSGAHGWRAPDGSRVCKAVDINRYAGHAIDMRDPNEALEAILAVIDALPAGRYTLGLPRPPRLDDQGGALDSQRYQYLGLYEPGPPPYRLRPPYAQRTMNMFLPVNRPEDIEHSPTGSLQGDLQLIQDPTARARLTTTTAAARARGANILFLYPDALDHLHLKAAQN